MRVLCLRQPDALDDLPLLCVTDARRVQPVGQLIGGPRGVMAHERRSEVLRNPCALTLCDEPLAGGVEHGASEFWMSLPEFCIPLHDLVHGQTWKQPA